MSNEQLSTKKQSKSNDTQIAVLDIRYNTMSEQIKELTAVNKEEHTKLFEKVDSIKESLDTLPERLDKRYASKETEDALKRINWMVISAVLVSLLAVVIKMN